jgi:branched-chain amino acid transport system substrate-binding protein
VHDSRNRFPSSRAPRIGRLLIALAACAAALATGCGRPIKVAFVGPLTGPSSAVGLGGRNGFLLALGEGPGAVPGRAPRLELLVRDDANDPAACLAALRDLKAAGCSLVVLGATSHAGTGAVHWAMGNEVLVISPTISTIELAEGERLYVRVNTAAAEYGASIARVAWERFGKRRVGTVGDLRNMSYVQAVRDSFAAEYARLGGTAAFDKLFDSAAGKPAEGLAAAIRSSRCDGLFVIAASSDVVLIAKELEKAGAPAQLFLPPWPLTRDLVQNGGAALEGAVGVSIADLEYRTPEAKAFEAAYLGEHGEEPSFTAMFGYEAAAILKKALSVSKNASPRAVWDSIVRMSEFRGLQGGIKFNGRAEAEREMFLFQVRGGDFARLE